MFRFISRRTALQGATYKAQLRQYSTKESSRPSLGAELKESFKKTSVQLFLVLVLGSTVLNIMKEKNHQEDIVRSFEWHKDVLRGIKQQLADGDVDTAAINEQLRKANDRAAVLGLPGSHFDGLEPKEERRKAPRAKAAAPATTTPSKFL